ncbi:arginine--tRNA ligase [Leptospira sp. GIMC2001]|uniref:arginine--tRNA ligase n=1 Tax=Leptospira sp. GIMC2001 TaxID=1513297 RepID=UPI00234A2732|nr:arginine--tRNA ligase [Leptospira sp. GIMC2001]WCL48305.1 arginine--tRNA ligase [Leptospira sp. GIMC2001]
MHSNDLLKEKVLSILISAANKMADDLANGLETKSRIEYSRDEKFGDYSTPFALENKNLFKKPPLEIANILKEYITKEKLSSEIFSELTVTPPGFINFRISIEYNLRYINNFLMQDDLYAKVDNPKKIILEFVSANPTGPLNIVSARAASFGDALASVLTTLGHKVDREFYVNDYGNQVQLLGVACILRFKEWLGETIQFQESDDGRTISQLIETNYFPAESYRGEYIIDIVHSLVGKQEKVDWIKNLLKSKSYDELIEFFSLYAVQFNLGEQKEDLKTFGVNFDRFFSERSLHESDKVLGALAAFEGSGDIINQEGKKLFLSTNYGDDKDRVVVRDDGRPTYLLADIAYHKDKMDRGYDEIIDIWGPDHHGYIARLSGAMESMGYAKEKFRVIICQQVNLLEDGKKVKMSKRLGNFQRMRDLILYLGKNAKDVSRYFFATRTAEAPLDFDLDLAQDESDKNPVFYLQYAHARISSIFREVGEQWRSDIDSDFEWTEDRARLLFWISRFHEEVYDAAISCEPHRITNYLQSLCRAFTRFYGNKQNRLKDYDNDTRLYLAYLCKASQIAIREGLHLLGISAPNRLDRE